MRRTGLYLGALVLALGLGQTSLKAVSRDEINRVRQLNVLTAEHLNLIDGYVSERLQQILFAQGPDEVADALADLRSTAQSEATIEEGRQVYSRRYCEAMQRGVGEIITRAGQLVGSGTAEERQLGRQMAVAAPVLLAACDNPLVIDELVNLLGNPLIAVRYWAVEGISQPAIVATLGQDEAARTSVIEALQASLEMENTPELVERIATWAARVPQDPRVDALLATIVGQRVAQYQAWDVRQELADLTILRSIGTIATSPEVSGQQGRVTPLVRRAADFYAAAGTRYVKAMSFTVQTDNRQETLTLLTDESQMASETLLIDGEALLLNLASRATDVYTGRMADSIRTENWDRVQAALEALVGTEGVLNRGFRIYSTGDQMVTAPDAPESVIERARTLATLRRNLLEVEY